MRGRIDGGDAEHVADGGIGRRATALAEDVAGAGEGDDVVHDHEVAGEVLVLDHGELALEPAAGADDPSFTDHAHLPPEFFVGGDALPGMSLLQVAGQAGGGAGYVLEYRGQAIEELSMEGRMTVCNMSIEAGARAGMIAPDETTFEYLRGRPHAPQGADWDAAVAEWRTLRSDDDATFDAEVVIDASQLTPFVTWGTNPGQGLPLGAAVPDPEAMGDENEKAAARRASRVSPPSQAPATIAATAASSIRKIRMPSPSPHPAAVRPAQPRMRQPASARHSQPARKAVPPMGVIMPSLPTPVSVSR